ncbi:MAG TPA: hypothetical protein VL307_11970, partial [Chitinophagaceae bacterium]|nr:hypothetical protein [Chitinophagaceae bacterium]
NAFYKIQFTRQGVITSLWDKRTGRECVKAFDKLYCNDLGSGSGNEGDTLRIENRGSVSATLVASSYKPVKHISKLTLFEHNDRIELENYLLQNPDAKPITYSFSFNLQNPSTWHEEAGAILLAKTTAKGGHYADTANRVDWLAMNHFAALTDTNSSFTVSNRDAYFMKTGKSSVTQLDDSTAHIKVMATAQVDNALGIVNQDGDDYFENFFALQPRSGNFSAGSSMRFSLEHQNPLVAARITGGRAYDAKQFSLFSVPDSNVLVWATKPAEEGISNGLILRLWNFSPANKQVVLNAAAGIEKAFSTTHIETGDTMLPVKAQQLQLAVGHHRMNSYRLFLRQGSTTGNQ